MQTPEESDWTSALGSTPTPAGVRGNEYVRDLKVEPEADQLLHLSWDVVGDNLRVRWTVRGTLRLDIFREGGLAHQLGR